MDFNLDNHGFFWVARTTFASWKDYLDRSGAYGGPGPHASSDGSIDVVFAPEGRDTSPLIPREIALVDWAITHERAVSDAAKAAIFDAYPALRKTYGYSAEDAAELMPELSDADDLKHLIGLRAVNIHQIEKDGRPYIGLEFGCTWDAEHGLGVLMHGTRVVEVEGSDTARLLWVVERDADRD